MTFIGKILTLLTLVLSILFASLSVVVFATHRNWRDAATKLQNQVAQHEAANKRMLEDIERAKTELRREQLARKFAVASLETQLKTARDQYAVAQDEANKLNTQIGELIGKANTDSTVLASVTTELGTLRTQLRDARADRDQQFDRVVTLTDEVHGLQGTRATLEDRNTELSARLSRFQKVLDANGLSEFDDVESIPPPLDGIVLAVGDRDLIEISLGSDDGLKVGHTLDVHRGATYLGRIVIKKTTPDRSVGQVIPEFRKGLIRTNDRVATRFVN